MKKLIFLILSFFIFSNTYAEIEDDSILKELNNQEKKELQFDFKLKKFKSCEDMTSVIEKYIKTYWKYHKKMYPEPIYEPLGWGIIMREESAIQTIWKSIEKWLSIINSSDNYSKTNVQVEWVDESDIIKTDWKYIYYYNFDKKYVYIIDARDPKNLKIIRKIKIPKYFYIPSLYIDNNKLVILASGSSNNNHNNYYINRKIKTYIVVFDISDKNNIKLDKIFISDWVLKESRKIGDYLYVVSTNRFNIPYYSFKSEDDIKITANSILPKKLDIFKVNNKKDANLKVKWKILPYHVSAGNVAKCNEIEYILPDEETLKKYDFNPSYNIITTIDLSNPNKESKIKVIAGSNNELYMSTKNMYLTERMYMPYNYKCPANARCIMPFYYWGTENTLIHKLSINKDLVSYKTSNIIPWRPLNQYSMDEKDDKFRIITTTNSWSSKTRTSHTDLYVLDENLKLYSSLTNIGEGERFQGARFMGDKLFLVTFKQIDPLFVIDLKNQKYPKIIWELKIPGYSKYLHPYDENHLIGLGYDTYENKWWGTRNGGLKIDLYEVNYDKKVKSVSVDCEKFSYNACPSSCVKNPCASACGPNAEICTMQCVQKCENPKKVWNENKDYIEIKQLYSLVLGDSGSKTEAMENPRMFMWNASKKLLLLPATLYKNESKDSYKHVDFFQWLIAVNIDKNKGIKEKYRITHINTKDLEEKRKKDCERYIKPQTETKCRKLIDWTEYCPPKTTSYVPEYCFADTPIWAYIAAKYWNFRNQFIERALWIGNNVFAISDIKVSEHDIDTGKEKTEVYMK